MAKLNVCFGLDFRILSLLVLKKLIKFDLISFLDTLFDCFVPQYFFEYFVFFFCDYVNKTTFRTLKWFLTRLILAFWFIKYH